MTEHTCIKIILLMQWMMLLLVYYFTLLLILYMTSSAPKRFRRSWFWGVTSYELHGVTLIASLYIEPLCFKNVTPQNQERRKRSGAEDVMYSITTQ